jgi:alcohol dehydrogenase YqhD (iron-dependent ADH family)
MKQFTNFNFRLRTEVLFGKGVESEAGALIKKHGGKKALVVYGGGSVKKSGLFDRVAESLKKGGIPFVETGGVQPNPRRSLVQQGVGLALEENVDFVLAVGGGSVIDSAKAIAIGLANGGDFWRFYPGKSVEKAVPVGTINTIAAAGSETSIFSVLVDDVETGRKLSVNSPAIQPVFALLNPELTYTVPAYQTAAGAVDIFAHTVMRYYCPAASNLGDEFAEGLLRSVVKYAPLAIAEPANYEARAELMLAAAFSHNDVTFLGRSGVKGGEHNLESQISGHYDTAHGAGLAVVMPPWMQYIADTGVPEQTARVAQFGVKVFGAPPDMSEPLATAHDGLDRFRSWLRSIGMPLTLRELGIPKDDLDAVVQRVMDIWKGKVPGFMPLDRSGVYTIFASVVE